MSGGGIQGLAVLTRYNIVGAEVLEHSHQPVDWEAEGNSLHEPRRGKRLWQRIKLETEIGPLTLHNVDFESHCGTWSFTSRSNADCRSHALHTHRSHALACPRFLFTSPLLGH